MLAVGTSDGTVQCWDSRMRSALGGCSPFEAIAAQGELLGEAAQEVTSIRFNEQGLQLAVGTSSGHIALYDIRRAQPLLIKDHQYGLPIVDIKFHGERRIVSSDAKIIKIWQPEPLQGVSESSNFTSIQPAADLNDTAIYKDSGLIIAGLETPRLGAYFVPALGPAPSWCHFLDNLTEEMEEQASATIYEDYKFVTREELERLQLDSLVGSKLLRPYMHGFFLDSRHE